MMPSSSNNNKISNEPIEEEVFAENVNEAIIVLPEEEKTIEKQPSNVSKFEVPELVS